MTPSSFLSHLLDQLDGIDHLEAKAMFGGHSLYAGGPIFGIVHDDRLYLKVDDETRPRYEAASMGPFEPNPGQVMKAYREVPAEVLEDGEALVTWAKEAIEVAHDA